MITHIKQEMNMIYATLTRWLLLGWMVVGVLFFVHMAIPHIEIYFE